MPRYYYEIDWSGHGNLRLYLPGNEYFTTEMEITRIRELYSYQLRTVRLYGFNRGSRYRILTSSDPAGRPLLFQRKVLYGNTYVSV